MIGHIIPHTALPEHPPAVSEGFDNSVASELQRVQGEICDIKFLCFRREAVDSEQPLRLLEHSVEAPGVDFDRSREVGLRLARQEPVPRDGGLQLRKHTAFFRRYDNMIRNLGAISLRSARGKGRIGLKLLTKR